MMMLATSSSISVPRKTMRSLSRRLKMSQLRSPRCVVSTTVGYGMKSVAALERRDGLRAVLGRLRRVLRTPRRHGRRLRGCLTSSAFSDAFASSSACRCSSSRASRPSVARPSAASAAVAVGDLRLALDEVEDLVLEDHADEHVALLLLAVLGPQLGDVLPGLRGELGEALLDVLFGDLESRASWRSRP